MLRAHSFVPGMFRLTKDGDSINQGGAAKNKESRYEKSFLPRRDSVLKWMSLSPYSLSLDMERLVSQLL